MSFLIYPAVSLFSTLIRCPDILLFDLLLLDPCFFDSFCSSYQKEGTEHTDKSEYGQHNEDVVEARGNVAGGFRVGQPVTDDGGANGIGKENDQRDKAGGKSGHFGGDTCLTHKAPIGRFKVHKE